jgi:hypothetical protein
VQTMPTIVPISDISSVAIVTVVTAVVAVATADAVVAVVVMYRVSCCVRFLTHLSCFDKCLINQRTPNNDIFISPSVC